MDRFEQLKAAIIANPVVRLPDVNRPFIVETDASQIAIGAVLKQRDDDGHEYVVSYYSRALSKSERNYPTYEREYYAVVRACEHFRVFLLAREFELRTDNSALTYMNSSVLERSSRVNKWAMRIQE